jgi:ELWxxDGT repeat protein
MLKDVDNWLGLSGEFKDNQLNLGLLNFTNGGGTLFFETPDPFLDWPQYSRGTELWKTDGTAAGTVMVADISLIYGKVIFQSVPATTHSIAGVGSGNSTTVFSTNSSHQLMRHDAINGWVWMRDNVQSISIVTETSGNVVVFAMTTDNALLRYDTVNGWQSLADPGTIRMISAGTDTSGLADVFVVLTNGSMSEWQQSSGWLASPLTEPDPVWQGNPIPGPESVVSLNAVDQGRVIVAFANGSVMHYDGSMGFDGFFGLPMDLAQYAAAVTDATGQLNVFAYSPDGGLWEWQEGVAVPTSSQIATDFSIQELSVGTDANGQANVFALTAAGALMEYQKNSGWTTLNPPGTVQDLSAGTMNQLFVVLTDGRVFERDDQHGFFQI